MTKRGKIQMISVELLCCYSATRPKVDQILKTLVKNTFGRDGIFTTCTRCNTSSDGSCNLINFFHSKICVWSVLTFYLKSNENHKTVNFKMRQSAFGILASIELISNLCAKRALEAYNKSLWSLSRYSCSDI